MLKNRSKASWANVARAVAASLAVLIGGPACCVADDFSAADIEFFETHVRPVLIERCYDCHGDGEEVEGSLRLTSRDAVLVGGVSGPAAIAGDAAGSLLVQAIEYRDSLQMPPDAKLSDAEIAALTNWVAKGLPWPKEEQPAAPKQDAAAEFKITDEDRAFWSFRPLAKAEPPEVADKAWPAGAIDRFILAKLEAAGLSPAPSADRRTLLRRATYDLTGLPPTPEEIEAFLNDQSPDAYARAIDRLLASPAYGERWARHWLDLVRYTDSFDSRIADGVSPFDCTAAWRFRDWVVDALNADMPYDEFVKNQIAGDLLPAAGGVSPNVAGSIASGMLSLGNWGGGDADKEKLLTDIADDQIDVVSRAFMGLTVACARCHDHKFDPISTADYYGLAGIFLSTHILSDVGPKGGSPSMLRAALETTETRRIKAEYEASVARTTAELESLRTREFTQLAERLAPDAQRYMAAAWEYAHWSAESPRPPIDVFAAERNLHSFAVRSWIELLDVNHGSLLSTGVDNLLGMPGLFAWRGAADTPSLVANANAEPVNFLSISMPARSVAIHPSPSAGVAVEWRAPVAGRFRIAGRLQDADKNCGNGVDWAVSLRRDVLDTQLAAGAIDNGGEAAFGTNDDGTPWSEMELAAGEAVIVAVTPRGDHSCDTTVVELTITETGSGRAWNLAEDVLVDPLEGGRGNPHRDAAGTPGVWRFLDLAGATASPPLVREPLLRAWYEVAVQPAREAPAQAEAAAAARAVQEAVDRAADSPAPNEGDPSAAVRALLTSRESPFWGEARGGEALLPPETQSELARLDAELVNLRASAPADPGYGHACAEGGCPNTPQAGIHDARIHIRGRYDRLGPVVPRRFPEVLAGTDQSPIIEGSGRLQLAEWLARPDHPLTARVMVNRIWQHHFGEGIVRTPSNFGALGERPTHPELLDYLAARFIASGWSIKAMHREIMLSSAYRQSSAASPAALERDGDNALFGRMNRRRLDAEQLRDSLLAASGQLDLTRGGLPIRDGNTPRRTLYLMTIRSVRATFRDLFDGADSTAIVDKRTVSTVAPQALYLLNDPFVLQQAEHLATRAKAASDQDDERISAIYRWVLARQPSDAEQAVAQELLAEWRRDPLAADPQTAESQAWVQWCQLLLCSNDFAFID